jgi:hypothetical protein
MTRLQRSFLFLRMMFLRHSARQWLQSQYDVSDLLSLLSTMSLYRPNPPKVEHDTLSTISQHMYVKHRNIFIGIGLVIVTGLTSFVLLRNYTYNTRDRLVKIRREIQDVTPGSESVFEDYHAKLKKRQEDKLRQQREDLAKH